MVTIEEEKVGNAYTCPWRCMNGVKAGGDQIMDTTNSAIYLTEVVIL